jgi:hypothetical protein
VSIFGAVGPNLGPFTIKSDGKTIGSFDAPNQNYVAQKDLYHADDISAGDHTFEVQINLRPPGRALQSTSRWWQPSAPPVGVLLASCPRPRPLRPAAALALVPDKNRSGSHSVHQGVQSPDRTHDRIIVWPWRMVTSQPLSALRASSLRLWA